MEALDPLPAISATAEIASRASTRRKPSPPQRALHLVENGRGIALLVLRRCRLPVGAGSNIGRPGALAGVSGRPGLVLSLAIVTLTRHMLSSVDLLRPELVMR